MKYSRRELLAITSCTAAAISLPGFVFAANLDENVRMTIGNFNKLTKSDDFWREVLPEDSYKVLFEDDTEPSFSSPLNDEKRAGVFVCAACNLPLFDSQAKYMSGTGWPSFTAPISDAVVDTKRDWVLLIPRTEYHCARCGGHQGHVFNDGPQPIGKRWCNNGLALSFVAQGESLPPLRT